MSIKNRRKRNITTRLSKDNTFTIEEKILGRKGQMKEQRLQYLQIFFAKIVKICP